TLPAIAAVRKAAGPFAFDRRCDTRADLERRGIMRSVTLAVLLSCALSFSSLSGVARAEEAAKPSPKKAKTTQMSAEKRRELERRIEALERKYEMQYRETDTGAGSPGAKPAPDTAPAAE